VCWYWRWHFEKWLSRVSGRKREGEDGYDMNDRKETRLKKVESTVEEKEKKE
jgi:hypothetical protein